MAKNKLLRYSEVKQLPNVHDFSWFRPGDQIDLKGRWKKEVFQNENPITLELACGKGEYTLGLSRMFPDRNFVGVDIKGERIWKGAKKAVSENYENVQFIRGWIDHLASFFSVGEIDEIWITFPDPYLKSRKIKKRLTSPFFLDIFGEVLKKGGSVNLKTDSPKLYQFTLETIDELGLSILEKLDDVYASDPVPEELQIKTYYEGMHLRDGRTISFVKFSLDS